MTPSSKWRKNYRCYGRLAEKCSSLKNARIRSFLNILFSQNGWSYVLQDILILLKENSYFYGKILATKYLACDLRGAIFKLLFQRNSKPRIKTSASINETFDLGLPPIILLSTYKNDFNSCSGQKLRECRDPNLI